MGAQMSGMSACLALGDHSGRLLSLSFSGSAERGCLHGLLLT